MTNTNKINKIPWEIWSRKKKKALTICLPATKQQNTSWNIITNDWWYFYYKHVKVLTQMIRSVGGQPEEAFLTGRFHPPLLFQADRTNRNKTMTSLIKRLVTSNRMLLSLSNGNICYCNIFCFERRCRSWDEAWMLPLALINIIHLDVWAVCLVWYHTYLCERRQNGLVLLQFKELADEVLFCETQRLQLTEDLLKYLQKQPHSI